MKNLKAMRMKVAGSAAAGVLALVAWAQPATMMAQDTATIHGHVTNPAGAAVTNGEVRLTTDHTAGSASRKYEYTFPLDKSGNYTGANIKPGKYVVVVFQDRKSVDFQDQQLAGADNKTVDFDMSRKEYLDKMSSDERAALEEYKKKNAETNSSNTKIANLNTMLLKARADIKAGDYDTAAKSMKDATAAKPDEAILWSALGDAELGQANAAAKTARANKVTDASIPERYSEAAASYQKALDLNAALAKPDVKTTAATENQLGQVYGKMPGKTKESAAAYEAAAAADPAGSGMYYFNEAATMFNAGDSPGAAAAADKAIAADPNKAEAYYIKGQSLVANVTLDEKTKKYVLPPGCLDAYQKYLELVPTGTQADEVRGILASLGESVKSSYKAGKK
jgi:hypothetical protein